MRLITIIFILFSLSSAAQAEKAPGFHKGLVGCFESVIDPTAPFQNADEVEGSLVEGFVVWYHGDDGQPIYAVRMGQKGDVISCQGPPPMGPAQQTYIEHDHDAVLATATSYGLELLVIPADGWYFANCAAGVQNLLLAVTFDQTDRIGIQVVKSAAVAQTCEKFGG